MVSVPAVSAQKECNPSNCQPKLTLSTLILLSDVCYSDKKQLMQRGERQSWDLNLPSGLSVLVIYGDGLIC